METVKINRDYAELRHLDDLGESALESPKLMDLIVNGATLMSVNKDTLRGIIRVLLTGAAAEVTRLSDEIPHWIPVSERIPEKSQNCLCYFNDGSTAICWSNGEPYKFHPDVTHWMPLPQPPKEEK